MCVKVYVSKGRGRRLEWHKSCHYGAYEYEFAIPLLSSYHQVRVTTTYIRARPEQRALTYL